MSDDIEIKQSARKPIGIKYGDHKFELSGRIPPEILSARAGVSRKGLTVSQYNEEIGALVIDAFYVHVLPAEFRDVIDLEDVAAVFDAWSKKVGLGESNASES